MRLTLTKLARKQQKKERHSIKWTFHILGYMKTSILFHAFGQMLMVMNGAEKERHVFIREGLWTYKSFRQGQRPNLAAIQKALSSAAGYQQEIISWQDFFHHELSILQGELHLAVLRASEYLNFRGWNYLTERIDPLDFYKREHFMQ